MDDINEAALKIIRATPTAQAIRCDNCNMMMIQGVPCHEQSCPNAGKKWDVIRECWNWWVDCSECGSEIKEGESCSCCE